METELGFIILRNVPKEEVQVDTAIYELEGGFRGFQLVPPGVHYIGVNLDEIQKGFWCYLQPKEALVKIFNFSSQEFEDDEPESAACYQQLALNGAMSQSLIALEDDDLTIWQELTNRINSPGFPPTLYYEETITPPTNLSTGELSDWMLQHHKSRFEQALFDTHDGDIAAFLAEFQFAFVRWFVDDEDTAAFNRWHHLLEAIYNAGDSGIAKALDLFPRLIDTLIVQFDCLPDEMFVSDSFVLSQAEYLAEDMMDSDIEELVEKGEEFQAYLEEKEVA